MLNNPAPPPVSSGSHDPTRAPYTSYTACGGTHPVPLFGSYETGQDEEYQRRSGSCRGKAPLTPPPPSLPQAQAPLLPLPLPPPP